MTGGQSHPLPTSLSNRELFELSGLTRPLQPTTSTAPALQSAAQPQNHLRLLTAGIGGRQVGTPLPFTGADTEAPAVSGPGTASP